MIKKNLDKNCQDFKRFLVNLLAQNPKRIVIFLEFYDFTNDWARKHGLDKNSETTPTNAG